MSDAELIALAALAQVETLIRHDENESRRASGMVPAYPTLHSEAWGQLDAELRRRGVFGAPTLDGKQEPK